MLKTLLFIDLVAASSIGGDVDIVNYLDEAIVTADKGIVVARQDYLPLKPDTFSLADLLLQCPTLQINDYGSLAGLKTVSFRGFGSAHTNIYIDGVRVSNLQGGQTDLGILPIEGMGAAIVNYAQNSIDFQTAQPWFSDKKNFNGKVGLNAGSFNSILPYAKLDYKLSENYSLSLNTAYTYSDGNFRYSEDSKRENNDIKAFKGGLDFFGILKDGKFHSKAYIHSSERGIPGSISLPSTDRQKDLNAFLQANMQKRFSKLYTLKLSGKISDDKLNYLSEWGNSDYNLFNAQLNTVHHFEAYRNLEFSMAADAAFNKLNSNLYNTFRTELFTAAAALYRNRILESKAALEYSAVVEDQGRIRGMLLPSLSVKIRLPKAFNVTLLARRTYSEPTFNDLFYPGYGNPELTAEHGWIMDAGIKYQHFIANGVFFVKINGYYHDINDKIISAPTSDPTIWLPSNIGKVKAKGLDIASGLKCSLLRMPMELNAKYSFMDVKEVPFTARHSCVIDATIDTPGKTTIGLLWQGRFGRTDAGGKALADWNTMDLNISQLISDHLSATLSLKNIFDYRYELVADYPMPGRSIILGLQYNF